MSKITLKSLIADYRRDKLAEEVAGDWAACSPIVRWHSR